MTFKEVEDIISESGLQDLWWMHPETEVLASTLMEFIASLDGHRGIDITTCLGEWLKDRQNL